MFSTFTGSSKRPRNVNLSGHAGNPFSNTSWSPSLASSAKKTISNAQADREKRQLDRQRLAAARKIQKLWRGHRTRTALADGWREDFDEIYRSVCRSSPGERLHSAFVLLLAFCATPRADDARRVCLFTKDFDSVSLEQLTSAGTHPSRIGSLVTTLVRFLYFVQSASEIPQDVEYLLKLIIRLISHFPRTITASIHLYFKSLAQLSHHADATSWKPLLAEGVTAPLRVSSGPSMSISSPVIVRSCEKITQTASLTTCAAELLVYKAFAYDFLACDHLVQFEGNMDLILEPIRPDVLSEMIRTSYAASAVAFSKDSLMWLLAHFIDLGRLWLDPLDRFSYVSALLPQLSFLSTEVILWVSLKPSQENMSTEIANSLATPVDLYVSHLLLSLVDHDGITRLLHDFLGSLAKTSHQTFQSTSVLAGYTLALLHCFPANADDTRMRLFLEQIPAATGRVPTVKYLWYTVKETSVFQKLKSESEQPSALLRRYLHSTSQLLHETVEEQEWRIILLFLELYTFMLRLSDDEDFASGMTTRMVDSDSSTSLLRSSSLPLEDVKALTIFLKNAAFALHYQANELLHNPCEIHVLPESHRDSYSSANGLHGVTSTRPDSPSLPSTRIDVSDLRSLLTTPLKMLYERDSRKHFFTPDDWLMSGKLGQEDFVQAVIVEEERQNQETIDENDEILNATESEQHLLDRGSQTSRFLHYARQERSKAQQMRSKQDRKLAEMRPKLEILKHIPFTVLFESRVRIFRQFVHLDRSRRGTTNPLHEFIMPPFAKHHGRIRRGHIFEDAFRQFYQLNDGLKDPIQITFVDQFGTQEAGIDGGGVTKEFLLSITTEAFGTTDKEPGLFVSNEQGLLFPNPTTVDSLRQSLKSRGLSESDVEWREAVSGLLKRYEFLGRIVGKCMYEGILVDLAFAGFFLLKWPSSGSGDENSYKGGIDDLRDMDEGLYNGMLRLKNYSGDVSSLGFDFTVEDQISSPGQPMKTVTRKLIVNGDETTVNNDNRLLYISYMARHRLVVQPALQTAAFLRGLRAIIRPSWLSMFNQSELQRLVGGDSTEIDIDDLRRNTHYSGLYAIGDDQQEHPTIDLFWKVMLSFTDAQRRDVLKYVSSTPRAPLLGFSQLNPKFTIRDGGTDETRLPSTSTCANLLKLPRYTEEATLRKKLLQAVTSGAGFDLS